MQGTWRFAVFLAIVLSVWTAMHAYVAWRLADVPVVSNIPRRWLIIGITIAWVLFPLARVLERRGLEGVAYPVELAGAIWLGVLFLLLVSLLATDVFTGFGFLMPHRASGIRGSAALLALALSAAGLVQGLRAPVVRRYEVPLPGLPASLDGTVLVQLSDLHLGSLLGEDWLRRRVAQVDTLAPDIVVITGDLVDGNAGRVERLVPAMRALRAPMGVWAVTGNHELYAGLDRSVALLHDAGFRVLRDEAVEVAPGLVMAGVDDLTARRQTGDTGPDRLARHESAVELALGGRPSGATVLLSHSPWDVERAAALGAGLMLSGHTHAGQIWPFGFLVRLSYPYLGGLYESGGMRLIVCRGTGTWGPPMRLWRRSEIVAVTLRSS